MTSSSPDQRDTPPVVVQSNQTSDGGSNAGVLAAVLLVAVIAIAVWWFGFGPGTGTTSTTPTDAAPPAVESVLPSAAP